MSGTQEQPLAYQALSVATMQEVISTLMNGGGTYAANQRLAKNAMAEMDEIARRLNDEKQQNEAAAFQRGADEQRRMTMLQAQHVAPIATGQPPSFLDPNGPSLAAISDGEKNPLEHIPTERRRGGRSGTTA